MYPFLVFLIFHRQPVLTGHHRNPAPPLLSSSPPENLWLPPYRDEGIHAFVFESVPVPGKGERIWWLGSSRSALFFCFSRADHFVAISSGCRRSPRARYTRLSVMTRQIRSLPRGGGLAAPAKMTFGPYRPATKVSIMETGGNNGPGRRRNIN